MGIYLLIKGVKSGSDGTFLKVKRVLILHGGLLMNPCDRNPVFDGIRNHVRILPKRASFEESTLFQCPHTWLAYVGYQSFHARDGL
jgi:hypothetical protein